MESTQVPKCWLRLQEDSEEFVLTAESALAFGSQMQYDLASTYVRKDKNNKQSG